MCEVLGSEDQKHFLALCPTRKGQVGRCSIGQKATDTLLVVSWREVDGERERGASCQALLDQLNGATPHGRLVVPLV